jgi:hypothetical protein
MMLALGGCFGVPLSRSKVEETLQTMSIEVGVADRAEVRRAVGQPLLSSEYWRFDVFRISDWNGGVLFFGYVPVPMWEKNEGFVVVGGRVLFVLGVTVSGADSCEINHLKMRRTLRPVAGVTL